MTKREAIDIVNGDLPDCSVEEVRAAWQFLVDTGAVWQLTLWHATMAASLIAAGILERNAA